MAKVVHLAPKTEMEAAPSERALGVDPLVAASSHGAMELARRSTRAGLAQVPYPQARTEEPEQSEIVATGEQAQELSNRTLTTTQASAQAGTLRNRQTGKVTKPTRTIAERREQRARFLFESVLGNDGPTGQYLDFANGLATLLSAGYTTADALVGAAQKSRNAALKRVSDQVYQQVASGIPLSQALAPHSRELPEVLIPILAAGEVRHDLNGAARELAEVFRQSAGVAHRFEYSVLGLPTFASNELTRAGERFPRLGRWGAAVPSIESSSGRRSFGIAPAHLRLRFKMLLPMAQAVSRSMGTARWTRTFATLWRSGVPISSALESSARTANNGVYAAALLRAAGRTREGMSLRESLMDAELLPEYLLDSLETGEITGDYAASLEWLAEELEDDAKKVAAQILVLLFWGTLLLGAALFAVWALVGMWRVVYG